MSHLEHDESHDWREDADAIEQQLRSLRPSPPPLTWSSIAESIEASLDQPAVVTKAGPTKSAWRSVASHSLTAAIGIAFGVALMLTLQQDNSDATRPKTLTETNTAAELVDQQDTGVTPVIANAHETESLATNDPSSMRDQQSAPDWRSQRFTRTGLRTGPLRVFGSIDNSGRLRRTEIDFNSSRNQTRQHELDDDLSIENADDLLPDDPVLSPRSLHIFLDELTHSPTSDVPFCKAKDCQS